jgi:hypothetical protein
MKVLVVMNLTMEEVKELDKEYWIKKNDLILELPAKSRICAVAGCYNSVGSSDIYCPKHTNYSDKGKKKI